MDNPPSPPYEFAVGDYIKFQRVVHGKKTAGFRTMPGTGRAVATPQIPEQIMPQRGEGHVTSIAKHPKRIGAVKIRTARVYAGSELKTVTAILDDAVLAAKQQGLFELEPTRGDGSNSMYGTDAKGGA